MNNRQFAGLIRRATTLAEQAFDVQQELTEAFIERYGVTYSDCDCDAIIDVLDGAGGKVMTVAEVDELMTECGHPPLEKGTLNPHIR